MTEHGYEKPALIFLDLGYDRAEGYCKTGGANTCGAGTGLGSGGGGQCRNGQYAGLCSTGTSIGTWDCKSGTSALACTSTGSKATTVGCTSGSKATTGGCTSGNRATGTCKTGSNT
ncbi:MAG: hypothetical protein NTV99_07640 [Deltaproteobacteria bacterium]|nr:hypothetical protein [Deltaproteobacteria bacterium]